MQGEVRLDTDVLGGQRAGHRGGTALRCCAVRCATLRNLET